MGVSHSELSLTTLRTASFRTLIAAMASAKKQSYKEIFFIGDILELLEFSWKGSMHSLQCQLQGV